MRHPGPAGEKAQNLATPQRLVEHRPARPIGSNHLKNTLGYINRKHANFIHGRSPLFWSDKPPEWHIDAAGGRPPHHPGRPLQRPIRDPYLDGPRLQGICEGEIGALASIFATFECGRDVDRWPR
jgi:hypothetical protein